MFRENKVTKEIRSRIKNRWPIVGSDHICRYFLEEFPRFYNGIYPSSTSSQLHNLTF